VRAANASSPDRDDINNSPEIARRGTAALNEEESISPLHHNNKESSNLNHDIFHSFGGGATSSTLMI